MESLLVLDHPVLDTSISLLPTTYIDIPKSNKEVETNNISDTSLLQMRIPLSKLVVDTIVSSSDTTMVDPMSSFSTYS